MQRGDLSCDGDTEMWKTLPAFPGPKEAPSLTKIPTVAPSLGSGSVPEDHQEGALATEFHELILLNSFTRRALRIESIPTLFEERQRMARSLMKERNVIRKVIPFGMNSFEQVNVISDPVVKLTTIKSVLLLRECFMNPGVLDDLHELHFPPRFTG